MQNFNSEKCMIFDVLQDTKIYVKWFIIAIIYILVSHAILVTFNDRREMKLTNQYKPLVAM